MKKDINTLTFPSYESASLRSKPTECSSSLLPVKEPNPNADPNANSNQEIELEEEEKFDLYSIIQVQPLLSTTLGLLGILLSPYIIMPVSFFLIASWTVNPTSAIPSANSNIRHNTELIAPLIGWTSVLMITIIIISLVNIVVYSFHKPISDITGTIGLNSTGAATKPGLYHLSFIILIINSENLYRG